MMLLRVFSASVFKEGVWDGRRAGLDGNKGGRIRRKRAGARVDLRVRFGKACREWRSLLVYGIECKSQSEGDWRERERVGGR